jgi:homocysteine S-methyltransferase
MAFDGAMSHHDHLPRPSGRSFLTDGGLETCLVVDDGLELTAFASFLLLTSPEGTERLRTYYLEYLRTANRLGLGFVLETPTWRANPEWGRSIGFAPDRLALINRRAVELMHEIRSIDGGAEPVVVSGCVGPRGDGHRTGITTAADAAAYHGQQIGWLVDGGADFVSALTIGTVEEGIGIATAAARLGTPVVISFTVGTDGRLPSGMSLGDAISITDETTGRYPLYYMVNCAHPHHLVGALEPGAAWIDRIGAYRPNASTLGHAELDGATVLDDGDPRILADEVVALRGPLPSLTVIGGCCGTDHRHVEAIAEAWVRAGVR